MFSSSQSFVFILLTFVLCYPHINGHVALVFPPARKYDLDFLDTTRTSTPCGGMKKNEFMKTSIENGKELRLQWHLGYPHTGGFRIELLDSQEKLLRYLTPPNTFVGDEDTSLQSYTVEIPEALTCVDCSIRLVRQAVEWGNGYQFQSCADVDILAREDFNKTRVPCSSNGILLTSTGKCQCSRTYFGEECQFKNDCEDDTDCFFHGKCIDIQATTLPTKQCFCKPGYFGLNCGHESSIKSLNFSLSNHERVQTNDNKFTFYWDVLPNGIFEGVIKARTDSWVAVGWRPKTLTGDCQSFPEDAVKPTGGEFHSMDCMDMVIGSVLEGSYFRVEDYYTRDRSTPRLDSFYGGKSDLVGAIGSEENGETTIAFQRKIRSRYGDKTDHDINGNLLLIWAHGRTDLFFYKRDELKFHGPNRGKFEIVVNFGLNNLPNILSLSTVTFFAIVYQLL